MGLKEVVSIIITVCIGSGCHVKGSRDIVDKLKSYLERKDNSDDIELEACFCQNHCTEGVVVKIDGEIVTNVTKDNIIEILNGKLAEEV